MLKNILLVTGLIAFLYSCSPFGEQKSVITDIYESLDQIYLKNPVALISGATTSTVATNTTADTTDGFGNHVPVDTQMSGTDGGYRVDQSIGHALQYTTDSTLAVSTSSVLQDSQTSEYKVYSTVY